MYGAPQMMVIYNRKTTLLQNGTIVIEDDPLFDVEDLYITVMYRFNYTPEYAGNGGYGSAPVIGIDPLSGEKYSVGVGDASELYYEPNGESGIETHHFLFELCTFAGKSFPLYTYGIGSDYDIIYENAPATKQYTYNVGSFAGNDNGLSNYVKDNFILDNTIPCLTKVGHFDTLHNYELGSNNETIQEQIDDINNTLNIIINELENGGCDCNGDPDNETIDTDDEPGPGPGPGSFKAYLAEPAFMVVRSVHIMSAESFNRLLRDPMYVDIAAKTLASGLTGPDIMIKTIAKGWQKNWDFGLRPSISSKDNLFKKTDGTFYNPNSTTNNTRKNEWKHYWKHLDVDGTGDTENSPFKHNLNGLAEVFGKYGNRYFPYALVNGVGTTYFNGINCTPAVAKVLKLKTLAQAEYPTILAATNEYGPGCGLLILESDFYHQLYNIGGPQSTSISGYIEDFEGVTGATNRALILNMDHQIENEPNYTKYYNGSGSGVVGPNSTYNVGAPFIFGYENLGRYLDTHLFGAMSGVDYSNLPSTWETYKGWVDAGIWKDRYNGTSHDKPSHPSDYDTIMYNDLGGAKLGTNDQPTLYNEKLRGWFLTGMSNACLVQNPAWKSFYDYNGTTLTGVKSNLQLSIDNALGYRIFTWWNSYTNNTGGNNLKCNANNVKLFSLNTGQRIAFSYSIIEIFPTQDDIDAQNAAQNSGSKSRNYQDDPEPSVEVESGCNCENVLVADAVGNNVFTLRKITGSYRWYCKRQAFNI